jgi:hypothetical protein
LTIINNKTKYKEKNMEDIKSRLEMLSKEIEALKKMKDKAKQGVEEGIAPLSTFQPWKIC